MHHLVPPTFLFAATKLHTNSACESAMPIIKTIIYLL
jgi:hypothetical protein